ncbi:MAG: d(CMP) kinase [Azospirillaceae bacterium]
MSGPVIAIDGTAASGKGTLARRLADHYGLPHMDTGAIYRACAKRLLDAGGDPDDPDDAERAAGAVTPADLDDPGLRTDAVAQAASKVSAVPGVRAALLALQQDFAARPGGAVLDGRDIGTVVCPGADAKIFVTAETAVRARRRFEELRARGETVIYDAVLQDMEARDARDSRRSVAPLRPADDALVLDTSTLSPDAVFERARAFVEGKTGRL